MAAARTSTAGKGNTTKRGARAGVKRAAAAKAEAGGERVGRGTRWTEQQVQLLLETVGASATAKEAFEKVARQLGKSTGTVQQKYYNLQRQSGGGRRRGAGRPAASGSRAALPTAAQLRTLDVDQLVGLAALVKGEVERRRGELDAAARQLAELAG